LHKIERLIFPQIHL